MNKVVFSFTLLSLASTMAFADPGVEVSESIEQKRSYMLVLPFDATQLENIKGAKYATKPTTVDEQKASKTSSAKKPSFFGSFVQNCVEKVSSFFNRIKAAFGF